MFRRKVPFDAVLIISQICAMSTSFYLSYVVFVLIIDTFFNLPFTSQSIINSAVFHFSTKIGWIAILGELFGGIISALLFVFLEGRFKKALDYISTTFIIHLVIVSFLCEFPKSFCWWISTLISFVTSTLLAGKISMSYEMQTIDLESVFPSAFRN